MSGGLGSEPPRNVNSARQNLRLEALGVFSEDKHRIAWRNALAKAYRRSFILGMVIGAFLSLLLPVTKTSVAINGHHYVIPFAVRGLEVWQRAVVYVLVVIANGYFWGKVGRDLYEKYAPQPKYRYQEQPPDLQQPFQPVYNLDDEE